MNNNPIIAETKQMIEDAIQKATPPNPEVVEALTANRLVQQGRLRPHEVVELEIGQKILANGVNFTVMNVTDKTIVLRPDEVMVIAVKGVPTYLRKIVDGNLVLSVVGNSATFKRKKKIDDTSRG